MERHQVILVMDKFKRKISITFLFILFFLIQNSCLMKKTVIEKNARIKVNYTLENESLNDSVLVRGYVLSRYDNSLIPNVEIFIKELKTRTKTNGYGFFELEMPSGSYTIIVENLNENMPSYMNNKYFFLPNKIYDLKLELGFEIYLSPMYFKKKK